MGDLLISMSAGAIIAIIISILPFIAIVGTWNNSVKIRKHLDEMSAEVEDIKELLKTQTEMMIQNRSRNMVQQGEWLGSDQTRL